MRFYLILFLVALGLGRVMAENPPAPKTYPRALPVAPSELTNAAPTPQPPPAPVAEPPPLAVPGGVNIHWYGHGFVYLTSSVGVRAAFDPFGTYTVHYKFPPRLTADFMLISHESEDHAASEQLFGSPLIFRSVTAVGLNRANGIPFYGVALQKDPTGRSGATTAFTLTFDGIRFCYIGQINQPLLAEERQQLGHADVLFLPVGLTTLSVNEFNQIAKDLGASVVIPINYKTDKSGDLPLRTLGEYLDGTKLPVRKLPSDETVVTRSTLPAEPTLYLLKSP